MKDNETRSHKQAAVQFLQLVIAGKFDEAYQRYVDMNGKHHNVFFRAGFSNLKKAMAENHVQLPNKQFTPINIIADGDFVAVHSRLVLKQGDQEMAVVHIFHFKGGKIVEMWDCGQAIPPDSPNTDGAF